MTGVVVDTSAVVAIVNREPGAAWLRTALAAAEDRAMAAPTAVELEMVLEGGWKASAGFGRRALRDAAISVIAFDDDLALRAADAWRRFGKGRHPAGLNLGDCFTYALAERQGWPILCVGEDFTRTDLPTLVPT